MGSDKVIIATNELKTTVEDSKNLNTELIVSELNEKGIAAKNVHGLKDLQSAIDEWANDESLLLILSNRTCIGLWESDFVKNLS